MQFVGAFTQYIDVPQVALYVFWAFFFYLVLYLHRESKREGYPLESDRSPHITHQGFPRIPSPKTYNLLHGGSVQLPGTDREDRTDFALQPAAPWPGAPLDPTGNPLVDGVGPAAWSNRSDEPDLDTHGEPKMRRLSSLDEPWRIASFSVDPIGCDVRTLDDKVVGQIDDVWIDTMEMLPRYYQVALESGKTILVPMMFSRFRKRKVGPAEGSVFDRMVARRAKELRIAAITSEQIEDVPALGNADRLTLLEEDKIQAYFGGGHMFATRQRRESLI